MHRRLRSLIERTTALLQVTALDQGAVRKNELTRIDLSPIVQESVSRARAAAETKYITIQSPQFTEPIPVRGNAVYLQLVFDNLLANAIKYSPESSKVEISCRKTGIYTFTIRDQGMGVPKDEMKKIFGGFYRAKNAKNSGALGSGFGLYITKKIVELHGGTITFDSTVGKGTTFSLSLPRAV
jgi:signal transduction histidine kinase